MPTDALIAFLVILAIGAIVFLALWLGIGAWLARRREHLRRRMARSDSEQTILLPEPRAPGWSQRFDTGFERMVSRTGLDLDPTMALAIIFFCGVFLAAATLIWRWDAEPWLALPAFLLGAVVPLIVLLWRQQVWRRRLQQQLPDTLFLLARSLRAGRSVDQAFQLIGEQGLSPLRFEFARMHHQMQLGLSLMQVLEITADRLGLVDFNIFASVMGLHRSTGGNLPALLDRLATSTRDRNQFEGQYRAATVLGRYSAAFILLMVGVILFHLFFFQRDWAMRFFDVSQNYMGLVLFTTAILLEITGGLLLYWFLRYEY